MKIDILLKDTFDYLEEEIIKALVTSLIEDRNIISKVIYKERAKIRKRKLI
ncbi:hypothetical protein lam_314 [Candidatus Liberibacter americanus str. Sao Paulo]|uniref:Uncharacterized protein n=1 Tax=Candidatus Liberibacter americanus str. Sao Paulo TaxID=1261131 RepID=U6B3R9_9HYPH|nr:hypothetical protein lam_314 [Candidatus Liberibacter americanus str. Sao Paulo]